MGSEAYPRRDCWRKVCRGKVNAVLRVEVLKAEVEGADLNAARAKVRAVEVIVKLLIQQIDMQRKRKYLIRNGGVGRSDYGV